MTTQKQLIEANALKNLMSGMGWAVVVREGDAAVAELERKALDEEDPSRVQAAHFKAQGAREFLTLFANRLAEAATIPSEEIIDVAMQ